jgi:hypothetical protein
MDAAVAMLLSGGFPASAETNVREIVPHRRNDVSIVRVAGFTHNSVTDEALVEPGDAIQGTDPRAALALATRILRSFFDRYLREDALAMDWLDRAPGVRVERFARPGSE